MQRTLLTFAAGTALLSGLAHAQTPAAPSVVQPATPAPMMAPTAASVPDRVTQTVYSPRLPTAQEITDAANAQGLTVERISQTDLQVIAFYRSANGQPVTVAYQSLPPAAVVQAPAPAPAPAPVVVMAPPTTVVYETAPRVIYYDTPRYYYPRTYYPPVSLSFGFGYRGGHHHHGHHHHGHRHHGWRH